MRIAQIAPLIESVPPRCYGGTERVVAYLTEELVRRGHQVTLFASGDSFTGAELVSCSRKALRLDSKVSDPVPHHMVMLDHVRDRAHEFDILHFHVDNLHFPLTRALEVPSVTTLHNRQDLADLKPLYRHFSNAPLVAISKAQGRLIPTGNIVATIYHGLPSDLYAPDYGPREGYLAFLGRISPEKRPDRAIAIARAAGMPLKLAAKVDKVDADYHRDVIQPLLGNGADLIGEIGEREKQTFLGRASALLFPIDWPEPFGLVMIEAMACGTPVLAFGHGAVPEVIEDGVTGYVVQSVEEAVATLPRVLELDRRTVRRRFEERFTAGRMAGDYLRVYRKLMAAANPIKVPAAVAAKPSVTGARGWRADAS